jgi:hypothetical protein
MHEKIRMHIAALNAAWQRYARAAGKQLDPATAGALNRDYVKAWEELEACGIAEWMLEYNPDTLTFSLKAPGEMADDVFTTLPMPAVTNRTARSRWRTADPDTERIPII